HPLVWSGEYAPTQTRLRFTIESAVIDQIKGAIEYVGDGTITDVEGSFAETPEELSTDGLWPDRKDWPKSARRVALRFREVSTRTRGGREPGLNGEYRAIASPSDLVAVWVSEA